MVVCFPSLRALRSWHRVLPLTVIAGLCLSACQDDPPAPAPDTRTPTSAAEPASMAAALARLSEFSKMRTMFERAGLTAVLSDKKTTMTLLVPRDTALAQLAPELRNALVNGDGAALTPLLKGLMIPRIVTADELRTRIDQGGGSYAMPTLAGHNVTITRDGAMLIVTTPTGKASMGTEALMTDNGAIYVLDHWVEPTLAPGAHAPTPTTPTTAAAPQTAATVED